MIPCPDSLGGIVGGGGIRPPHQPVIPCGVSHDVFCRPGH